MQFSKINESNETALLNQNPPHFKTVRKVIFFQYKNVLTDVSISRTIKVLHFSKYGRFLLAAVVLGKGGCQG